MKWVDEFLNAFPLLKDDMKECIGDYAMKKTIAYHFEQNARRMYTTHIKEDIARIKEMYKGKGIRLAYLDVARYQTDVRDASIAWGVDEDVLGQLLKMKPPPGEPKDRLKLEIPDELRKKREIL